MGASTHGSLLVGKGPRNSHTLIVVLCDEWVSEDLFNSGSPFGVDLQNPGDQVSGFLRHGRRLEVDSASLDGLLNLVGVPSRERGTLVEHLIEKNAHSPNINSVVLRLVHDDLGGHVLTRPAKSLSPLFLIVLGTPPKIANLDIVIFVQQNVLRLQVSMQNLPSVDILNCLQSLQKEFMDSSLRKGVVFSDVVEEIPIISIIQQEVELSVLSRQKVVKLDNIGVIELEVILNLPVDVLDVFGVDGHQVHLFEGVDFAALDMADLPYCG